MPGVAAAGEAGSSMPDRPTDGRAMTEFSKRGAKVESWFQGETGRMYNVVQVGAERCTVCRCAHMYSAASAPSAVSSYVACKFGHSVTVGPTLEAPCSSLTRLPSRRSPGRLLPGTLPFPEAVCRAWARS